jgi:hypothetical protein
MGPTQTKVIGTTSARRSSSTTVLAASPAHAAAGKIKIIAPVGFTEIKGQLTYCDGFWDRYAVHPVIVYLPRKLFLSRAKRLADLSHTVGFYGAESKSLSRAWPREPRRCLVGRCYAELSGQNYKKN